MTRLLVKALAETIDVGLTQEGLSLSPVQAEEAGITAGSDEIGQLLPQGHRDGGDQQPDSQRDFSTFRVAESDLVEGRAIRQVADRAHDATLESFGANPFEVGRHFRCEGVLANHGQSLDAKFDRLRIIGSARSLLQRLKLLEVDRDVLKLVAGTPRGLGQDRATYRLASFGHVVMERVARHVLRRLRRGPQGRLDLASRHQPITVESEVAEQRPGRVAQSANWGIELEGSEYFHAESWSLVVEGYRRRRFSLDVTSVRRGRWGRGRGRGVSSCWCCYVCGAVCWRCRHRSWLRRWRSSSASGQIDRRTQTDNHQQRNRNEVTLRGRRPETRWCRDNSQLAGQVNGNLGGASNGQLDGRSSREALVGSPHGLRGCDDYRPHSIRRGNREEVCSVDHAVISRSGGIIGLVDRVDTSGGVGLCRGSGVGEGGGRQRCQLRIEAPIKWISRAALDGARTHLQGEIQESLGGLNPAPVGQRRVDVRRSDQQDARQIDLRQWVRDGDGIALRDLLVGEGVRLSGLCGSGSSQYKKYATHRRDGEPAT